MRRQRVIAMAVCAALWARSVPAQQSAPSRDAGTIVASHADASAITLDGNLSEAAWQAAAPVKLTQQSPRPGASTPYETEVRVLAAGDRLYLGFTCHDPQPGKIAVHTMARDGAVSGDDTVSVVLDTYGDRRTGYYFLVNAAGARVDGLISGPEEPSLDWDGIWDARTQRTAEGWTAEIVIPTRTLSFARGLTQWGANFERFVPRDRLNMRWAGTTLDSFIVDLSRAGTVSGLGELEQGKGLEFSPYTVGRSNGHFRGDPRAWQGSVGGDVTWKITPQLVTVGTFNTDFAETEVDARQINLTRFPLFFPEKRAFFLEGSNQYVFGLGLNRGEDSEFLPFFSRRIGLLNGEQIPIDAGVKLNGRVGRWNLAMLDVETRETQTQNSGLVPNTNLLASRVSYDVTDKFRVGGVFTNGDPQGLRSNQLTGFDAVYRTSTFMGNKNFLAGAWTARSTGDIGTGDPQGWGLKVDYPNDLFDCNAAFTKYGDALEPDLGFLPRPGTRHARGGCAYQPRPSKDGPFPWIRQVFFENEYEAWTDLHNNIETWDYFMAPINVRMETGDRFEFNYNPHHETLNAPFEISPGVLIPPGDYTWTRFRLEAQSSPHRVVQAGTTTWFGTFYDGTGTHQENYLGWTSRGHWSGTATMASDFIRLREGSFVERLWQLKGDYAWTPNLVLSTYVQYDTVSKNVGTNTRLRWTIRPGNDLFIVWNRGWQKAIRDPHELNLVPDSESIAVKLRWTFRK
jgi:hypothetical protein